MIITSQPRRLYFAYGSNMSSAQMQSRCPDARPVGTGQLQGWRRIINTRGVANIVVSANASTGGVLWSATDECFDALDWAEGVRFGTYDRIEVPVSTERGGVVAETYVSPVEGIGAPRAAYLERLTCGLRDFGLWNETAIMEAELCAEPAPVNAGVRRPANPFRPKSNSFAIAELLFDGGVRRDLARQLSCAVTLAPYTKPVVTLADYDKRLLLTAQKLRDDFGCVVARHGRGLQGTIRVLPRAKTGVTQ